MAAAKILPRLRILNNILLIPMFTLMVAELYGDPSEAVLVSIEDANVVFCALFFAEWALGLLAAEKRMVYLRSPANLADLISSIPFAYVFQGARLARVGRIVRLWRMVYRAKRYRGLGRKVLEAVTVFAAVVASGAYALRAAEPSIAPSWGDALWWALVSASTVGYGDIAPETPAGRVVGAGMMVFGVGVFGYAAGIMATYLEDPEETELLEEVRALRTELADLRSALGAGATPES